MQLLELENLQKHIELILNNNFSDHLFRVRIEYSDSPNPVCFFEVEGKYFIQGSFWANDEYCIEAINTEKIIDIIEEKGFSHSILEAITVVNKFLSHLSDF